MTLHDTIHRRGRKPVPVELRRRRAVDVELCRRRLAANEAVRDHLREVGCAAVAHALGLNDVGMGGVMTGERGRKMDRKGPNREPAPKRKLTQMPVSPAPGLLAADISRNIFPDRQRQFGADLIGGVL